MLLRKGIATGWPLIPLGEVLTRVSRPEPIDPRTTYRILGAHWYAQGLYTKEIKIGQEIRADKVYRVEQGDFVYNRLFAWKGSFAVATIENHGCYVSSEFPCFVVKRDRLDDQYLRRYFSRQSEWTKALALSSGGTPTSRNRLKQERLLSMTITLPSLDEQRRVVARVEKLSARLESARNLREQTLQESENLTGSVLQTVFEKLVHKCESRTLSDFIVDAGYGTSERCTSERMNGAVPVLRIPNVASERINFENLKFAALSDSEMNHVKLNIGDVLIVRTNGSLDLVGRSAVVTNLREPTAFASYLIRIRGNQELIRPSYLQTILKHLRIDRELINFARTTAGQYNISLGRLRAAKIPVPPLEEQDRTVAFLDGLQAKVEELKRIQRAAAPEIDVLLPSILDKAFEGKL